MNAPRLLALAAALSALLVLAGDAGAQGKSLKFNNAQDGYIEVAYAPELVPATGLTLEAWVQYDDAHLPSGWRYPTIIRQNGDAGKEAFFLRVEAHQSKNPQIRFLINTDTGGVQDVSWNFGLGGLITWTHLAATYDGATMRLFADGSEVASAPAQGKLVDQGNWLRIGKGSEVGSPMEVWNGDLDEVRLWPFARTEAELQATMYETLHSVPGQVATWNLDGNGQDTSGPLDGSMHGSILQGFPAPGLTFTAFPGAPFGLSTPGCDGDIRATVGSMPHLGSTVFSMVARPMSPGSQVFGYLGFSSLPVPLSVLGVDVWINPVGALGLFPGTVDAMGVARLDFPIPAGLPAGLAATVQFIGLDGCGPQGMVASNGLGIVLIH